MGRKQRPMQKPCGEASRQEPKSKLDARQRLFYQDVIARVRVWKAEGKPARRNGGE